MPAPRPVPEPLSRGPFTAHDADRLGITRWQRRGSRYRKLSRAVHEVITDSSPENLSPRSLLLERARPVLDLTPRSAISHASAGLVWRFRLPRRLQNAEPVHVTRADDGASPRRSGIRGHHAGLAAGEVSLVDGVRVTSPVRTLLDLATSLTPEELVACVDGVVCEHRHGVLRGVPPLVRRADLIGSLEDYRGRRGARRLRLAAERSVPGADSVPETRLRLLLEEHGIHGHLDHRIGLPNGAEVLPDIAVEPARVSVQYEGGHHDRAGQREIDIRRQRRTEAAGWTEVRIVHRDLTEYVATPYGTVPRAVAIVRAAMTR